MYHTYRNMIVTAGGGNSKGPTINMESDNQVPTHKQT